MLRQLFRAVATRQQIATTLRSTGNTLHGTRFRSSTASTDVLSKIKEEAEYYAIYPALGISRLGNSFEYFYAPEIPNRAADPRIPGPQPHPKAPAGFVHAGKSDDPIRYGVLSVKGEYLHISL